MVPGAAEDPVDQRERAAVGFDGAVVQRPLGDGAESDDGARVRLSVRVDAVKVPPPSSSGPGVGESTDGNGVGAIVEKLEVAVIFGDEAGDS